MGRARQVVWVMVVGVIVGASGCVVPPGEAASDAGSALPDVPGDDRPAVAADVDVHGAPDDVGHAADIVDAGDGRALTEDVPAPDVPSLDVAPDVPTPDVPTPDVPALDVPTPDVPAPDVPAPDVPYGALGASCRAWVPLCLPGYPGYECEAGLVCVDGRCAAGLPTGARCGKGIPGLCAENSSCVDDEAGAARCTVRGSLGGDCISNLRYVCDEGGTERYVCLAGLLCSYSTLRCIPPTAPGAPCTGETCGPLGACVGAPGAGVCVTRGTLDAPCRAGLLGRCDEGLSCLNVGGEHPERCRVALPIGARCDPAHPEVPCVAGSVCGPGADGPRCIASGSVGGPCSGGGYCSAGAICAIDRCLREAAPGAACEPRFSSVYCTGSSACVPYDRELSRGTCTASRPEREPNAEATPELLAGSAAISGVVRDATDGEDCFQVMVPTGGTVVAETTSTFGVGCFASLTSITIANPARAVRVESSYTGESRSTCARALASALEAGAYTVCVRTSALSEAAYLLSLAVLPP